MAVNAVYRGDAWLIEVDGEGTFARYPSREEAVSIARSLAQSRRTECIVHYMDGTVQETTTWAEDEAA
jgi:hypothetical protein